MWYLMLVVFQKYHYNYTSGILYRDFASLSINMTYVKIVVRFENRNISIVSFNKIEKSLTPGRNALEIERTYIIFHMNGPL